MDTATAEHVSDRALGPSEGTLERALRWAPARGVPATRDLELTLWTVLGIAGVAISAGALTRPHWTSHMAFAVAGVALVVAIATLRAVAALRPVALSADRPWRRFGLRVAVAGTTASAADLRAALRHGAVRGLDVVGAITPTGAGDQAALGDLDHTREVVQQHAIDLVLVGPGVSARSVIDVVMRTCEGERVRVCTVAELYEEVFGHVPIDDVDSEWFEHLLHPRFHERRSQRIVDVTVAGVLAIALLPVVCVAALLIRRDGGPALFRQARIGRDGRCFVMYKLRTMRCGEESTGWTLDDDPRLTSIGRHLRRSHVDELPQLVNVLRGDMTLVGPRPEQPSVVAGLERVVPMWRGRHHYRPGLTGWAQVRCGYAGSHDGSARKLAHDLYYLRRNSLALDAAILAQTARMLVAPRTAAPAPTPFLARGRGEVTRAAPPAARRARAVAAEPRALVTGGAGFIGSHLVDGLLDAGHPVLALDDLSAGTPEHLAHALSAGAQLETLTVIDADAMVSSFRAFRPEVVFHLAAQIEVGRAVDDPLQDAMANVVGTLAVLEAARACGARRFVLASSGGAVYGDAALIPTPEHAALSPLSPYGGAKVAAEHYAALYGRLHGLSTIVLRLANVYGPRQGAVGEGGVVARFCRARVGGAPAEVFGDGRQTRDYVHVRDVVAAFVAAGGSEATGALNVGTQTETSVLDLVGELGLIAEFRPQRPGEVARSCLDASAAARVLGWWPQVPLAAGLPDTLAYMGHLHEGRAATAV
jgi:UDP-glucose 4-epimerase